MPLSGELNLVFHRLRYSSARNLEGSIASNNLPSDFLVSLCLKVNQI